MAFLWRESDVPVLNPQTDFRINTVSRAIAHDLQIEQDDIWWLLVVEPREGISLDELVSRAVELNSGGEPIKYLAIPPEYPGDEFRSAPIQGSVTLYARREYINAINRNWEAAGIDWLEVGPAFRQSELVIQSEPFASAIPPNISVPEGSVVMAVIDHGMAVGHDLFRNTDNAGDPVSRVEFFWNMEATLQNLIASPEIEETSIGVGLTEKYLSERLKENMHNGLLDDQAFYRSIGATDWATRRHTSIAHRLSHGTHVMGLCAGFPTNTVTDPSEAEKRPIIAVNLRTSDVHDPSGYLFVLWLELVRLYILERYKRFRIAGQPNKRPPLVINFSFGNFAGPHDGTSVFESIIKKTLAQAKNVNSDSQFVLPAGNSNQSRCHARIKLSEMAPSKTLDWRVQPDDHSRSVVQIWLDDKGNVADDYVTLTVDGPGSIQPVTVNSKAPFETKKLEDQAGNLVGQTYFLSAGFGPFKRGHFRILLYSTAGLADVGPFAPAGLWRLTLDSGDNAGDVGLHAWVERDETLPGFPTFGRQSFFDDPDYARFYEPGVNASDLDKKLIGGPLGYDPEDTSALGRRDGTLSGFASSAETIVIGGFVDAIPKHNADIALASSTGLTLNGGNIFPDASARSDASTVLGGVLSAGSASGSLVAMQGTSVSAPQVARWVADNVAPGLPGNPGGPAAVRQAAEAMDPSGGGNPSRPPDKRSGGGRMLDLEKLFGQSRWPGQSE